MATRFKIVRRNWRRPLFTIHFADVAIPVHIPALSRQVKDRERMVFTWPGGGEYIITGPHWPGCVNIISPDGRLWSGLQVFQQHLREKREPAAAFLWQMEDQTITCD